MVSHSRLTVPFCGHTFQGLIVSLAFTTAATVTAAAATTATAATGRSTITRIGRVAAARAAAISFIAIAKPIIVLGRRNSRHRWLGWNLNTQGRSCRVAGRPCAAISDNKFLQSRSAANIDGLFALTFKY